MKSLLLIIDLQNAFINENTNNLPKKIEKLIDSNKYNTIAFTKFINFENSIFANKLNWKGCIDEEDKKIVINTQNNIIFNKTKYSVVSEEFINYINDNKITEIYLCGIDTECCVLKTAFDLFELGYNVYVLKDYCACTKGIKRHNNAIEIIRRNIGKNFVV